MTTADNTADSSAPQATKKKIKRVHPMRKRRVRNALKFFSVAAWVTGVMLILLVVRMIMEYVIQMDMPSWATWVAILHGWAYFIFIIATLNLGLKARWEPKWWVTTMLGGVVPFLSFYVENNRRKQVVRKFQLDRP